MRIVITHGTQGSPEGNWFPWLAAESASLGHQAVVPRFPTPENQSLDSWLSVFDAEVGFSSLNSDTVLIGHSLGVPFLLQVLMRAEQPVKACFLVSGFLQELGIPDYDLLNKSFVQAPFDWESIQRSAGSVYLYHGDNDPYVPLDLGSELADWLKTPLRVLAEGGHINSESGYTQFPELLEDLTAIVGSAQGQ